MFIMICVYTLCMWCGKKKQKNRTVMEKRLPIIQRRFVVSIYHTGRFLWISTQKKAAEIFKPQNDNATNDSVGPFFSHIIKKNWRLLKFIWLTFYINGEGERERVSEWCILSAKCLFDNFSSLSVQGFSVHSHLWLMTNKVETIR